MLDVRSSPRRGVLRVRFLDTLASEDFTATVQPPAAALCARHGCIRLLILDVRRFGGWSGLATFAAQIRFLRSFSRQIERVAVIGPPAWRGVVPALERLFVVAEIRCFAPGMVWELRAWLR